MVGLYFWLRVEKELCFVRKSSMATNKFIVLRKGKVAMDPRTQPCLKKLSVESAVFWGFHQQIVDWTMGHNLTLKNRGPHNRPVICCVKSNLGPLIVNCVKEKAPDSREFLVKFSAGAQMSFNY